MLYVCGHRNPDVDSVCAAHCYAALKRRLQPDTPVQAIRLGRLNEQTQLIFERAGVEAPPLVKDLHPRVREVVSDSAARLGTHSTIFKAIQVLERENLSILPVFDEADQFAGTVSTNELSRYLAAENRGERPTYSFAVGNFAKIIPGRLLRPGRESTFSACIMTGAMPKTRCLQRLESLAPIKPLLVAGLRPEVLTYAAENDVPAIILTGVEEEDLSRVESLLTDYEGTVYLSAADTAETIRLLRLSIPVSCIMESDGPRIDADRLFKDVRQELVESELRGLPIFEEERFLGMVTRRCFIEEPRKQLIMVDHNEASQSAEGVENVEVVEILDHHRLGALRTAKPIYIAARPVGSTCTIVAQHYPMNGLAIPRTEALLLLAGILSDTVVLRSPTTTGEDRNTAEQLATIAEVSLEAYGEELYSQTTTLETCVPREAILTDFKEYQEFGTAFGIGQMEVSAFAGLEERSEEVAAELERIRAERHLDWAMLMVTHVLKQTSVLFSCGCESATERLIYHRRSAGLFDMPRVLSRKKQLLPEVLRVLEGK